MLNGLDLDIAAKRINQHFLRAAKVLQRHALDQPIAMKFTGRRCHHDVRRAGAGEHRLQWRLIQINVERAMLLPSPSVRSTEGDIFARAEDLPGRRNREIREIDHVSTKRPWSCPARES